MSQCAFADCTGYSAFQFLNPNMASSNIQRVTLFAVQPLIGDAFGGCVSLTDVNPISLIATTFVRGSAISLSANSSAAGGCVFIQAAAVSAARTVVVEGCSFTQCTARSFTQSPDATSVAMGGAVSLVFGCVTCDFIVTDFSLDLPEYETQCLNSPVLVLS